VGLVALMARPFGASATSDLALSQTPSSSLVGKTITVTASLGAVADDSPVSFVVTGADRVEDSGIVAGPAVVGMAVRPAADGYWLVAPDGTVLAFGAAQLLGDAAAEAASDPVVGIASTSSGNGYWLATAAGKVLTFGDAAGAADFAATIGGDHVVAIARTPENNFRLVTTSGRILPATGDASVGDLPADGIAPAHAIVGLANTPTGKGYWLFDAEGKVYEIGRASCRERV